MFSHLVIHLKFSDGFHYGAPLHWSHRGLTEAHSCHHNHRKYNRKENRRCRRAVGFVEKELPGSPVAALFVVDIASEKPAMCQKYSC